MSKSAFSARVFAIYLFILGPVLLVAPNILLGLFGLPATSEVWIRILGVLVVNIGIFTWVAAKHDDKHVLAASVWSRCLLFIVLAGLIALRVASPVLLLFGVIDLLAGLWTHLALKADAAANRAR